jgi:hypothetical protein
VECPRARRFFGLVRICKYRYRLSSDLECVDDDRGHPKHGGWFPGDESKHRRHGKTAQGYKALTAVTGGLSNSAFGANALLSATTGNYNTSVGSNSGVSVVGTSYSTFIGNSAGYATNGAGNSGVGYGALRGVSATGTNNTALGFQAGFRYHFRQPQYFYRRLRDDGRRHHNRQQQHSYRPRCSTELTNG